MAPNFRLIIEYDGSAFHGWQRQKKDRSVQGCIEQTLARITRTEITLFGSGRTDAGVHALGQVASFRADTALDSSTIKKALNSILPQDIVIRDCRRVDAAFHARFSARSKVYHYQILNRDVPQAVGRQYAWHIRNRLAVADMQKAVGHIIGRHDFSSFEGTGSPRQNSVRRVIDADWAVTEPDRLLFRIEADGFLRHMVRNLVGTMVEVGLNRRTPMSMKTVLAAKDRHQAGATAPARGLFLMEVKY